MPPKPKFTREEVAAAALQIIREAGVDALTARSLGARLGTSARPIFTLFKGMDEVRWAARELAMRKFEAYIGDYEAYTPAFKRVGMQMVSYGIHEPELYKLLFMQERPAGHRFEDALREMGGMADTCTRLIERDYHMTHAQARTLFEQMWVHAFAMGALCALKVCDFTQEEISQSLGQVFVGLGMAIHSGRLEESIRQPVRDGHAPKGGPAQ